MADPALSRNLAICWRNDRIWFQLDTAWDASLRWSIPETLVTLHSGETGDKFDPNGTLNRFEPPGAPTSSPPTAIAGVNRLSFSAQRSELRLDATPVRTTIDRGVTTASTRSMAASTIDGSR